MTWLPVVEREMRVAARRPATYRIRFLATLVMLGVFAFHMLSASNSGGINGQAGRELLAPLTVSAFLFAISIGVMATSDSVSEEKREGTLGLLFLTDLKGYDVILGKLVAHSINAFYALVAITPVLGMPLLMGGVTLLQFVKLIIALITAVVLSLAAGIFVSTHSRNERKAMVFTFLLLLAVTCLPFLVMIWLNEEQKVISINDVWRGLIFSPGFAVGTAALGSVPGAPAAAFWYAVALSWAGAIVMLIRSAKVVPRSWTEKGAKPVVRLGAVKQRASRKLLDDNPFFWLAMRGEASPERVWLFVGAIFAIWLIGLIGAGSVMWGYEVILPTVLIVHVGLKIWVAGEASRRFIEDRRNNAMEFLLSTPLQESEIIGGQWRALVRQFLRPVLAVLAWETVIAFAMMHFHSRGSESEENVAKLISSMFFLALDIVALGWIGMWLGMKCKGRGRAMVVGLGVVLVLPWLLTQLTVTMTGIQTSQSGADMLELFILVFISFSINLIVIIWGQARLSIDFRRLALATMG